MATLPEKYHSPYDPKNTEDTLYARWEASGLFNPDVCIQEGYTRPDAESFCIVLPPPNVTGQLHLGHAFEDTTQDALIRFNRMRGKRTLWVPGTDHAAIATQAKFEKQLYKDTSKSRHDFSREDFFHMVQEFALGNQKTILSQLRKMGTSLDWDRLCFTLDADRQHAVFEAFKRMYDTGLIYRKHRVVNWDPKGQTTISDDEVIYVERPTKLYTFRYSHDCPIPIATTRPETKLGDTGIAVHPEGAWKEYIGKEYSFNFAGEPVTVRVIGDESVDPEFGTGALGVTPAHSIVDWEISERHNLPVKQVINEYGKMMVGTEAVQGKKTADAREAVVAWLQEAGLLEHEEDITQNVSTAERTGAVLEPLPKLQWWVDVNQKFAFPHDSLAGIKKGQEVSLKELMLHVVESGQITIIPERFDKSYRNWIENLRDWNISRQIQYGHRVPVWYRGDEIQISLDTPGQDWEQDEDTLDTWFSSGLWTFSTLGWPNQTNDLAAYHPTSVINPGYEILYLWVSRMILFSTFLVGQIPFSTAFIHGMLRDKNGQKFSKSLNNGIDPLDMIEQYGTDALRMALTIGVAPGQDMTFDTQKVKAYKKFANKLWNIARYVLENTQTTDRKRPENLDSRWEEHINEFEYVGSDITDHMENFQLHLAGEKLYHYVWHTFADGIIEESKEYLASDQEGPQARHVLRYIFETCLRFLHPFMPFITEEIWQDTDPETPLLLVASWPDSKQAPSSGQV